MRCFSGKGKFSDIFSTKDWLTQPSLQMYVLVWSYLIHLKITHSKNRFFKTFSHIFKWYVRRNLMTERLNPSLAIKNRF